MGLQFWVRFWLDPALAVQDINIFCVVLFFSVRFSMAAEPNFTIFKMKQLDAIEWFSPARSSFLLHINQTFFDINDSIILNFDCQHFF